MDNTYQELSLNDIRNVEITIYRDDGTAYIPSGASYEILGTAKQNTIVSLSPAIVSSNKVHAQVGLSVTASAADYDINWQIRKNDDVIWHTTKLKVS